MRYCICVVDSLLCNN